MVYYKVSYTLSIWSSSSTPACLSRRNERIGLHKDVLTNVHCYLIPARYWEQPELAISPWMDNNCGVFIHTMILFNNKKEQITDVYNYTDEFWRHYIRGKKLGKGCFHLYILEKAKPIHSDRNSGFQGPGTDCKEAWRELSRQCKCFIFSLWLFVEVYICKKLIKLYLKWAPFIVCTLYTQSCTVCTSHYALCDACINI